MKKLRVWGMICLLGLLLCFSSGQAAGLQTRHTTSYFSTVSALFVYTDDSSAFERVWAQTKQILSDIQSAVSLSDPESDLSRFNALGSGESCPVSPITAEILRTAKAVYDETGGLYDPTVFPLVDLWGFSPRFNTNQYKPLMAYDRPYEDGKLPLPDVRYVEALRQLVGLEGIVLSGSDEQGWTLSKQTPSVTVDGHSYHAQLDLGGIAKGYACDRVKRLLQESGFENGHFVCGGSSIAVLSRPDGDYQLTIGKPRAGENSETTFASLPARDVTLSTSSDASHTYTRDGVLYCHIIDPRTGYPLNMPVKGQAQRGIACTTLLGESAARGDALTTALCLMGPAQAAAYINDRLQGNAVVMALYETGKPFCEVVTNVAQDLCTITDTAYRMASRLDDDGNIVYTGELFETEINGGNYEQEPG